MRLPGEDALACGDENLAVTHTTGNSGVKQELARDISPTVLSAANCLQEVRFPAMKAATTRVAAQTPG
jgi:hypothetical protein